MSCVVDHWADCGNSFTAYDGTWRVEMLQNGYARAEDRHNGLVTLIDPEDGTVRSGPGLPGALAAEITRRWGT